MNTIDPKKSASASFADSKPHFELLDGLRGVVALLVVWYHIFEGFAFAGGGIIQSINHGYLAVDFFFMLSGFVIAYAYDDKWKQHQLTHKSFFKRRFIRLHPMVVLGAVIGLITFLIQGSERWDGTQMSTSMVMISLLLAVFIVPTLPGSHFDVRGNGEMYPLNGPAWSLFFEYIGNLLYALFVRRLSNKGLIILVTILGVALIWFTTTDQSDYGMFGVGWTLDSVNFLGGLIRMMFPFTMGILLQRHFKPIKIRGAFWICSALLAVLFIVPFIESTGSISLNGVYESFCIICVYPLIIWAGASGSTTDQLSSKTNKFLGDISFPLYIVHYPLMYLFYSWLIKNKLYSFGDTWLLSLIVVLSSVILAYASLKLYDEPLRKWLSKRWQ